MIIGASTGPSFIFIIVIAFLLLWLIVVRPQKKRQIQQQQMISELRVGDEVLTAGGIYGTVSQLEDDLVTVEIAPGTQVRVARRAIAGVTRDPEEEEDEEAEESQADDDGSVDSGAAQPSNEEIRG